MGACWSGFAKCIADIWYGIGNCCSSIWNGIGALIMGIIDCIGDILCCRCCTGRRRMGRRGTAVI